MTDFYYRLTETTSSTAGEVQETFSSSPHVASPWGPQLQHGGPVSGLLTRAMERTAPRPATRISRVSVDILGPVPVADVRVSARTLRPGRRIELLGATLEARAPDGQWRAAATATAWRLATQPTDDVETHASAPMGSPPDGTSDLTSFPIPASWRDGGFVAALTWGVLRLGTAPGDPSTSWINLTLPLVEGEETSGLAQLVSIADVANGVGARLDTAQFSFVNTDLTVQVHGEPVGPWFGMQAETSVGADGVGMADAVLHGATGPIGRVTQNLLVERLPTP